MKRILTLAMIVVGTCAVAAAKQADTAGEKMQMVVTPAPHLNLEARAAELKLGATFEPKTKPKTEDAGLKTPALRLNLEATAAELKLGATFKPKTKPKAEDAGLKTPALRLNLEATAAELKLGATFKPKTKPKTEDAALTAGGAFRPEATFRPEAGGSQPGGAALPARKVAVTFDDLPAAAAARMTGAEIDDLTARLLGTLKREKIPAVGFVNEAKIYRWGEVDARIKALQMWLDDGFELGNHTYSHASLNKAGLQAWEENVIEGEPVLKLLLAQHHMTLRYFRHPYLDAGLDLNTRRASEEFLASRGYTVAPVTMDAWDWMFAPVYAAAKKRGDTAEANKVVQAYLDYSNAMFDYDEKFSKQLIGYEPKQVLLLHGTELEADHFADLAALLRKRGYSFVTLDEALTDSAYNLPDTYVGEGTGWLDQWAITQGKMPPNEPAFPSWVEERAKALHQPQEQMP